MKKRLALLAACLLTTAPVFAYQVTGPVLEVTDTKTPKSTAKSPAGSHRCEACRTSTGLK